MQVIMKTRNALLAMTLLASPLSAATLYQGGSVIDVTSGQALDGAAVLVEGERIVAVGAPADMAMPEGTQVVDVSGKFLVPGLIDTHIHFMESGRVQMDKMLQMLDSDATEEADIAWMKPRIPYSLTRYICSGVTTAVSLGGPLHFEFEGRRIAQEQEVAPRILVAGGPIANSGFEWIFDGKPATYTGDTEEELRSLVQGFDEKDAEGIKFGYIGSLPGAEPKLTVEQFAPVLAAAIDEAHQRDLPTLVHIMEANEAHALVNTGLDAFAHLPFDEPASDEFVQTMVEKGIAAAPTIAVFQSIIEVFDGDFEPNTIEQACMDPQVMASYTDYADSWLKQFYFWLVARAYNFMLGDSSANVADTALRIEAAGGRLIIGSDAAHIGTPHGVAIHREMQMLEDHGLKPVTILQAATINGAQVMRVDDDLGSIEAGKLADFLVLDRNPLETVYNAQYISRVIKGGSELDRQRVR